MKRHLLALAPLLLYGQTATDPVRNRSFETIDLNNPSRAANWAPYGNPYLRATVLDAWDGMHVMQLSGGAGGTQIIPFSPCVAQPVLISMRLSGSDIQNLPTDNIGANFQAKLTYSDGTNAWSSMTAKNKRVGTFSNNLVGINTWSLPGAGKPLCSLEIRPQMGFVGGLAKVDDVHAQIYPLKEGLLTFVFDDSLLTTYTRGYPLLQQHGFVGSIAAVWNYVMAGTANDGRHMSLAQHKDLALNRGWSVLSHTMSHPHLTTLSLQQLNDELYWSQRNLVDAGIPVWHIATPFGEYDGRVTARVQAQGYTAANGTKYKYLSLRNTDGGVNPQGVFPYNIFVDRLETSTTTADIMSRCVNPAKERRSWCVVMIHEIDNPYNNPYNVSSAVFADILYNVKQSGIRVVNYDQGFDLISAKQ